MVCSSLCKVRTLCTGLSTYLESPHARAIPLAGHDTWVVATAVAVVVGVVGAVLRSFQSLRQNSVDPTDQLEPAEIHRRETVQKHSDRASFPAFRQTSSLEALEIETS